jgi:hypothetical protein
MKKLVVILALIALPSTSSAGMFCDNAAAMGYRASWANIACIMELVNDIILGGYDDGFDRTNGTSSGDADDLGG